MRKISTKAAASLTRIVEKFRTGNLSDVRTMAWIRRDPDDDMPSRRWTWKNQFLAYSQTGTLDSRGYRQWQRAGRHVKKGASAAYIWSPCIYKDRDDEEETYVAYKATPVFSFFDTEGEALAEIDYTPDPAALPPLLDVAAALGLDVTFAPIAEDGNAYGWYSPSRLQIALGSTDPRVFFHELGHALHDHINKMQGKPTAYKETVAEFTACILSAIYTDDDRSGIAWQYISHYNDDPLKAVMDAIGDVAEILETLETLKPAAVEAAGPALAATPTETPGSYPQTQNHARQMR